jgi:hypothetical protein
VELALKDYERTIHLLASLGAFDGVESETDMVQYFRGEIHVFQYLLQQICPPYYNLPLEDRFKVAISITSNKPCKPKSIKLTLTPNGFSKETINYTNISGISLLHYVAASLAYNYSTHSLFPSNTNYFDCNSSNYTEYKEIDHTDSQ